jgi:hypothetical protein
MQQDFILALTIKLEFGILLKELNIFQQKFCAPQLSLLGLPCHKMLLLVMAAQFFNSSLVYPILEEKSA